MKEGLTYNIINDDKMKITDYSFKANIEVETTSEKKLTSIIDQKKIVVDDIKISNSTQLLEKDKKIEESKKKINDKDKNILDHLTVLQKFRML